MAITDQGKAYSECKIKNTEQKKKIRFSFGKFFWMNHRNTFRNR